MPEEKKTKILYRQLSELNRDAFHITTDISALYEIIRSNQDPKIRKNAATHILKIIEDGSEVDDQVINGLFKSEKEITVSAELKRILNKLRIREMFMNDPTTKFDRKLNDEEEARIIEEIDRLRELYDKSFGEKGAFERKYKLVCEVKDGGMGKIYKAVRREDNQIVAIKFLLLEELSKDSDPDKIIARFKREGEILKRLSHPNIVKGYEYGEADGEYFIVMEYIEGGTVEDMIANKLIDLQNFKTISLQLCDAASYIHKNAVIHRDIKPGNILINSEVGSLQIKLSDFGLSKDKTDSKLSKIAFQAGTDFYSSPQQLQDARFADERDDIFSMGKTFYEMLTGSTFMNDEPYIEISKFNAKLSEEVDQIIKKCIAFNKDDRFQSVSELRESLKKIL